MENKLPGMNWIQLQSDDLTNKIDAIVMEIGDRLTNPAQFAGVRNITQKPANLQTAIDSNLTIAYGYPGIAILFAELGMSFSEAAERQKWFTAAAGYWTKIQESVEAAGFNDLSLFCGTAGIGMTAGIFSQIDRQYEELLIQVKKYLIKTLPKEFSYYFSKLGNVEVQDYDVIYGLAGIGRFLLQVKEEPFIRPLLEKVLGYLVQLAGDIPVDGPYSSAHLEVPGWYIAVDNLFDKEDQIKFPNGHFDLGLSHGIPGPLALLSISLLNGVEVDGQRETISKIAGWLTGWYDAAGGYWPCFVSLEEYLERNSVKSATRDAWCYGTPGIARSLWLAGCALNDNNLKNLAITAFDALFARPQSTWNINSPMFCHGFTGLLCLTNLMYWDTGLERFAKYREIMINKIINCYKPDALFGFFNINPAERDGQTLDKAGLLEGAAGIALTLLSVIKPVKTGWTDLFLIS